MSSNTYGIIIGILVYGFLGYSTFYIGPDYIAVNEKGEIERGLDKYREKVQRVKFWHSQLDIVEAELTRLNDEPNGKVQFDQELKEIDAQVAKYTEEAHLRMKQHYEDDPNGWKAYLLRKKADELERQANRIGSEKYILEMEADAEKDRLRRISQLEQIKQKIVKKISEGT